MSLILSTLDIFSETRFPFRTADPSNTVQSIIDSLTEIEASIDSADVDSEVVELETGGAFFGRNTRPCLNIKLRNTKVKQLKKFGCAILPVAFGNLVYLLKYEYMEAGLFDSFSDKEDRIEKIKQKLDTLDKWMEYTFIQTLGDYVYVEMLKNNDPNFNENLAAFKTFFTVE